MVRNSKITRHAIKTVAPARFTHKALSDGDNFLFDFGLRCLGDKSVARESVQEDGMGSFPWLFSAFWQSNSSISVKKSIQFIF